MRFPLKTRVVSATAVPLRRASPAAVLPAAVPSTSSTNGGAEPPKQIAKNPKKVRLPDPSQVQKPLWAWALDNGITKHYQQEESQVHLTAINQNTDVKAIAKLSLPPKAITNARVTKLSKLPGEAVEALGGIIMDSKRPPKQLQSEADTLSGKLEGRGFPANPEEVRRARRDILDEIMAENPSFMYEWKDGNQRPDLDREVQRLVDKRLSWTRYNWKPLKFKQRENAIVYALSRFGGHFAEMRRVLAEFDRNGFVPETILDYGSGIGSSFWAAFERWGNNVREYALMDQEEVMRHFSMDLLRGRNYAGSGDMVTPNVFFRKDIFPSPKHTYDLVILHRTLIELPSHEERMELIEKLWKRTKRYLVVVDSPLPDAFKALIKIRNFILTAGVTFDPDQTKELLREHGQLDQDTIEMFADKTVQQYEKYCVAREKLPEDVPIPTRLEPGHVFAPCPHDQACPRLSPGGKARPCKFTVRWQEFRADHKTSSKDRDGTQTGEFSYFIMEKGTRRPAEHEYARILDLKLAHKCVPCKLCTPHDGIQQVCVSKKMGKIYARVRRSLPSQLFPVKMEIVRSEVDMLKGIQGEHQQDQEEEEKVIEANGQQQQQLLMAMGGNGSGEKS